MHIPSPVTQATATHHISDSIGILYCNCFNFSFRVCQTCKPFSSIPCIFPSSPSSGIDNCMLLNPPLLITQSQCIILLLYLQRRQKMLVFAICHLGSQALHTCCSNDSPQVLQEDYKCPAK